MESGACSFGLTPTIGALNFSQEKALPVFVPYLICRGWLRCILK